ncbi:ligase-associated DNA damage response endonuclease PdeM [Aliiroseovarius crassostreae]|nr:ligase-associated DNA damage response endonuclease PdeM [Aliiroseovarius crassostreae]
MSDLGGYDFTFANNALTLLPSGSLWWAEQNLLCLSDLHLGKSERLARRGGHLLPPYETDDGLLRLEHDIALTKAQKVICLGDSFDDLQAADNLREQHIRWLSKLMSGREWIWIEGNHDPGPLALGGTHLAQYRCANLTFRHIADPKERHEISGHYHPKARLNLGGSALSRPAMLIDERRLILPAFGTFTGGLFSHDPVFRRLLSARALAVLLGQPPRAIPMPR